MAATLNDWTGIPVAKMLEGGAEKLLKMEERLARRVVGQDEAVRAIAKAVRRGRVGLRDPGKPIGSFLFLGPSGVGKTELAKALAEFLFDDEQALTRMDMSEYMERHMAQRLIGAPPGYADSEQGGMLRRRPDENPTAFSSSMRSRRPTPMSSTCCFRCSTTGASPTAGAASQTSRTPSSL